MVGVFMDSWFARASYTFDFFLSFPSFVLLHTPLNSQEENDKLTSTHMHAAFLILFCAVWFPLHTPCTHAGLSTCKALSVSVITHLLPGP